MKTNKTRKEKFSPSLPVKRRNVVYKEVSDISSVSPQTVKTVIETLSQYIIDQLQQGNAVEIPIFQFNLHVRQFTPETQQSYSERGMTLRPRQWSPYVNIAKKTRQFFKENAEIFDQFLTQLKQ